MEILLLVTVFLPLVGAGLVVLVPLVGARRGEENRAQVRAIALAATALTLVLAATLISRYPVGAREFAVLEDIRGLGWTSPTVDVRFSIGLDGLNLWLFGLTALLMIVAVLVSWEAIRERFASYYCLLLLLETGMLGVFTARDVVLFYVFFESTLIPLFFLIGIWGSRQRRYAAIKFFLFSLAGSVLTFLGLLAIVLWNYYQTGRMTFSIPALAAGVAEHPIDRFLQMCIFLALFAGFAIKVPLFPLHTWLPLAHVEAPTAGSMILAGVLLKVGTYGFVRFSVPMLPEATAASMPWLLWLSVAGIIYGALVALVQSDIKRLLAYSGLSHLGFCMLGVFALNRLGMQGGVLQMVNHGLSAGGLFAVVGMLHERYHTRQIKDFGGMARKMPVLAFFMLLLTLSTIGLPGLNGFAGQFLLLLGMFQRAWTELPAAWVGQLRAIAVLAVLGAVLGAWYMLRLVERVFFGPQREPAVKHNPDEPPVRDLCWREILALASLAVFIFWIGLKPGFFLDRMNPTLERISDRAAESLETAIPPAANDLAEADEGSRSGPRGPQTQTALLATAGAAGVERSEPPRGNPARAARGSNTSGASRRSAASHPAGHFHINRVKTGKLPLGAPDAGEVARVD